MKGIIIVFLIFNFCFCQKVLIVDIQSKQTLSFVNVYLYDINNKLLNGNYCDVNGLINISNQGKYDKVEFTHIGYKNKIVTHINNNDSIFLTHAFTELKEIVLLHKLNTNSSIIGLTKYKRKLNLSAQRYFETVVFMENKSKTIKEIKSFLFQIKKNKTFNTLIKIHIYENNISKKEPGDELLKENITYVIKENENGLIEIDLEKYKLSLPIEGAFIGIEWLGIDDNNSIEKFFESQNELDTNVQFNDEINEQLTFMRNRFRDESWESSADLKLKLKNLVNFKNYPNASFGIKIYE